MKQGYLTFRFIRPTIINSYIIEKLEIDLKHINHGLNFKKGYGIKARSNFEAEEIVNFFESLNGLEVGPEVDSDWEYFVVDRFFLNTNKKYRMVFCIDRKEPNTSGIITFFQIKRGHK